MTTTLEPPTTAADAGSARDSQFPPDEDRPATDLPTAFSTAREGGRRLRHSMTAVRLSFNWMGVRKTLTPGQREAAAGTFGAAGQYLSAGKKLIDTSHPSWRACTAVRSRAQKYWTGMTLPWPEPGVRLIRRDEMRTYLWMTLGIKPLPAVFSLALNRPARGEE